MIKGATKLTYDLYRSYLPRLRDRMALAMCDKNLLRIFRQRDKEMSFLLSNKGIGLRNFIEKAPIECVVYKYRKSYADIIEKAIELQILDRIAHKFPKGFCTYPGQLYCWITEISSEDLMFNLFVNAYEWVEPRMFKAFVSVDSHLFRIFQKIGPGPQLDRFLTALSERLWERVEQYYFPMDEQALGNYIRIFRRRKKQKTS